MPICCTVEGQPLRKGPNKGTRQPRPCANLLLSDLFNCDNNLSVSTSPAKDPPNLLTQHAQITERNYCRPHAFDLPAIYPFRYFPRSGGLVSYGIDQMEQARGGASYIDRVLRGANPGELPVQLPTRYELAINLKTAKTLGLKIPESLLLRADEMIE